MPFTQCSIFLNKDNILFCNTARPEKNKCQGFVYQGKKKEEQRKYKRYDKKNVKSKRNSP